MKEHILRFSTALTVAHLRLTHVVRNERGDTNLTSIALWIAVVVGVVAAIGTSFEDNIKELFDKIGGSG